MKLYGKNNGNYMKIYENRYLIKLFKWKYKKVINGKIYKSEIELFGKK